MTATTQQRVKKVIEFYNAEIADLRAFEAKIKGKESFKQAILRLLKTR